MKRLFLASSVSTVAHLIADEIRSHNMGMKLLFIPTAAEVEDGEKDWLDADKQALINAGFLLTDFSLTGKKKVEVESMLDTVDGVFLSGGNTFYLLQEIRRSGFDTLIDMFVARGMYYIGSSAGSVVAGPDIDNAKLIDDALRAPNLRSYKGLGLTDVEIFPHWGSEYFEVGYMNTMKYVYKSGHKIILLADDQYVCVQGDRYQIV